MGSAVVFIGSVLTRLTRPPEGWLRERLGGLGFPGDAVFRPLSSLSEGERVRAQLVRLALAVETCDLLLLDEPSNHLDALAQEAVLDMISKFEGALVVVTHDESFARRIGWSHVIELNGSRPSM